MAIARGANMKTEWLTHLLSYGIPHKDTFQSCFAEWVRSLVRAHESPDDNDDKTLLSIDGNGGARASRG